MAIRFTNNVHYLGKKAFVGREEYDTLADMKGADANGLNNGLIAFNHETNLHYVFEESNTEDATTGKWRKLSDKLGAGVKLSKVADPGTYAAKYELTAGGEVLGTIDIPKDQFLSNVNYDHASKNLTLTVQDGSNVEVSLTELVDVYTAGDGISIAGNVIAISPDFRRLFEDHKNTIVDATTNGHVSKEQYVSLTKVVGGIASTGGHVFTMSKSDFDAKSAANGLPEDAIIFVEA